MNRLFRAFNKNDEGIALIEFIMVFPVLFILIFAAVELTRYIFIVQKVDKAAYVLTDLVGQYRPATLTGDTGAPVGQRHDNEIGLINIEKEVLDSIGPMLAPFDSNPHVLIITSVVHTAAGDRVRWQVVNDQWPGSGQPGSITGYTTGGVGKAALLQISPNPLVTPCNNVIWASPDVATLVGTMPTGPGGTGENFIVGEVFFHYTPLYQTLLNNMNAVFGNIFVSNSATISRQMFLHPRNTQLLDLPWAWQSGTGTSGILPGAILPPPAANPPAIDATNLMAPEGAACQ